MTSQQQQTDVSYLAPLMTITEKTDPTDIRINNRMMIFSLLFPNTVMSRAQISRRTGLSRVSVSEVVSEMIDHHILVETGQEAPSRRGKKGTLIGVETGYWNIISLDLSQPFIIQGAVTNILGQVLSRAEQPVSKSTDITPDTVIELCQRLIDKAEGTVLGIGIAVPGIVDDHGTVTDSRNLDWSDLHLGDLLEERFDLPCFIDNDANSAALTERFFGDEYRNMLFIQISIGVGAAILIDDSMVLGTNHAAGEIGHVVVEPDGAQCTCGKHGCLETLVSTSTLRAQMAAKPEERAAILQQAGAYLGKALSMPASLLDITDIVVYGPPDVVNDTLLDSVTETLDAATTTSTRQSKITARRCECGENNVIIGESISVVQSKLKQF